jgi:2-polyprenyl-6-methoxyphenol hydroxylase-like FAD-dependent oxidoreductase
MNERVLVSGAGIAGCCLGWWLHKYGYDVTVVEQAARPRDGGYVIDFWGLGYEVAERMGLLDELGRHDLRVRDFRILDAQGRQVSGIDQGAIADVMGGRVMSLPRSAIARALYDAIKDDVNVRFGDSVSDIRQAADGVDVGFQSGRRERFGLVFGAGGLHSPVRRVVFGPEREFESFLGYYAAAFTAPGYGHRDLHAYVAYGVPGRQMWRITLEEDASVFLLVFADARPDAVPIHDSVAQKAILTQMYSGMCVEADEMLEALQGATDLYADRMSQIIMPRWTNGRVALLGDACACPSLLAGEGSAMAMAEAYTLAGELHAADGDYACAFAAYEAKLQPYVARKQKAARGFASSFVPKSAAGVWLRNAVLNVVGRLGMSRMLFRGQFNDVLKLSDYGSSA